MTNQPYEELFTAELTKAVRLKFNCTLLQAGILPINIKDAIFCNFTVDKYVDYLAETVL